MFATLLICALTPFAHAEGARDRPPGLAPVVDIGEVAHTLSGQMLRIEALGTSSQITVRETGEVYAVSEDVAEAIRVLCDEDTLRAFADQFYRCIAR